LGSPLVWIYGSDSWITGNPEIISQSPG
jgi:hypothetical protein